MRVDVQPGRAVDAALVLLGDAALGQPLAPRGLRAPGAQRPDVARRAGQRGGERRPVDVAGVAEHDHGVTRVQRRDRSHGRRRRRSSPSPAIEQGRGVRQRAGDEPVAHHDERRHRPQRDDGVRRLGVVEQVRWRSGPAAEQPRDAVAERVRVERMVSGVWTVTAATPPESR